MFGKAYGLTQLGAARLAPLPPDPVMGASLQRRSLYILPTREGLYYAAMLAVMLVAAVNYANGLAYALTFLLAALGLVAILHTHRNLVGLRLSAGPAPPVFAGEPARFTLVASNDTGLARYAIEIALGGQALMVDVPAQGTAAVDFTVPTAVRGYLEAPPLRVRTRFPIGLWRAWSRPLVVPARCLVYPRPGPEWPLPEVPSALAGRELGHNADGEDFAGLREFQHGDPVQRVAWKKVAAGQGWHTKQFSAPAGQLVWLDWETLYDLDVEARLSQLSRWVLMAEQQGISYGLRLPLVLLEPSSGAAHRDRCLERLALFQSA